MPPQLPTFCIPPKSHNLNAPFWACRVLGLVSTPQRGSRNDRLITSVLFLGLSNGAAFYYHAYASIECQELCALVLAMKAHLSSLTLHDPLDLFFRK